ncbi:MAG: hypothetical protein ACRC2T_07675 [Thermoguttaceae bacterium]
MCLRLILIILLVSATFAEAQAQGRRGGRRAQAEAANAQSGEPAAEQHVGEVPKLVNAVEADRFTSAADSSLSKDNEDLGSIVPVMPYKVMQYAGTIFEKYDTDGDGFLQREEWLKMLGAPQSMDIDGDFEISFDEFLRHIAVYGLKRSWHKPNPPDFVVRSTTGQQQYNFSGFRPLSGTLQTSESELHGPDKKDGNENQSYSNADLNKVEEEWKKLWSADNPSDAEEKTEGKEETESKPVDSETSEGTGEVGDNGENAEKKDSPDSPTNKTPDDKLDDISFEKILSSKFKSQEKKYATPLSEFKGLPAWFFIRDKDGDGQLSMLEYDPTLSAAGMIIFGKMDKNGDGFITTDEMRQYLETINNQKKQ